MPHCNRCGKHHHHGHTCARCHPKVHDNVHPHGHYQGLPVVFAPGFDDYQILKDHTGCDQVYVGMNTVVNGAIMDALTVEKIVELFERATSDEEEALRCVLGPLLISSDADNNLSLGSDKGLFENDAVT